MNSFAQNLEYAWHDLEDVLFDFFSGIETRSRIAHDDLQTASPSKVHATAYQAVWLRNVRKLIAQAERHGFQGAFLDVGCGKGKACFTAALYRFPEISGIDFDGRLVAIAERNKQAFRAPSGRIRFSQGDAAEFLVPEGRTLIFMFNPFDAVLLETFIRNNTERIRAHRSMIAYANDNQRAVLEQAGMRCIFREEPKKISLWEFPV